MDGGTAAQPSTTATAPPQIECPVCGEHACDFAISHNNYDLFSCARCATVFLASMPSDDEIARLYDDSYDNASSGYFAKVDKKMHRSRGRIRYLKRFVKRGRFLDIGCNGGFMTEAAREAGFDAFGLDLDRVSIEYARRNFPDNEFFHGSIETLPEDVGTFDLIYCSEVIEHVPNCQRFVRSIAGRLRLGGILFVTTPDISHWRRPRNLLQWDGFAPPSHCIYFNPRSLAMLMNQHRLKVVARRPAFKPGIKLVCRREAQSGRAATA